MTPDANDLCVFAIKRGSIENRLDINYNLPQYAALVNKLRLTFGDRLKPIGEIADVICGPFGSAIKNGDYQESGIPLVRITNISKDGYMDYSDLVYISEDLGNSLSRTQVSAGDIVISQRGSLGQCAVVDERFSKLNISANIIAIKNIREMSAKFIHDYLLSSFGQKMLERSSSGQVQQKITTQDIADVLIPIGCDEVRLTERLKVAHDMHTSKTNLAKELLECGNNTILDSLGITIPTCKEQVVGVIRLSNIIEDKTFSTEYYHPERMAAIHAIKGGKQLTVMKLSDIVSFHRDTVNSAESAEEYLGLAGVQSCTGELSGTVEEAAGQAFEYKAGDVLYGRLRPYLNKVLLAETSGICSTEFHVMRIKNNSEVLPGYLAAILRSDLILLQTKHMMTGNTHPRISNDDVKNLYIPIPSMPVQRQIEEELQKRRMEARALKLQAEKEWAEAKAQFEKELLGET